MEAINDRGVGVDIEYGQKRQRAGTVEQEPAAATNCGS